jgi:hypothetical protein
MEIEIYRDYATGLCRSCQAAIVWVERVDNGRRHPYNPPLDAQPIDRRDGNRTLSVINTTTAVSHFATCPQATQWRKPRR